MTLTANSCPRCTTPKARKRLGAEWCCWELAQLATLIAQGASMREVAGVLAGRSEKSIDATCRRYGLKVPQREREPRRKRCPACSDLFAGTGKCCAHCAAVAAQYNIARAA